MKVLVTGVTGFIGSAVARALRQAGTEVRGLVRPGADMRALDGVEIEPVPGDLGDAASLRSALTGCRQLYHVAAHYALWARDDAVFHRVNVEGTRAMMAAAREADVERIVYTSTIGTIGLPEGGGAGTEDTPIDPARMAGGYKRSKYAAEQEVLALARDGWPVVIVNPSAPVGVGDVKPTPTGRIIVDFLHKRMPAYLETGMNLVDVEDVAVGHLRAMARGRVGERYILGGRNLMLKDLFEILSALTGVRAPTLKLPHGVVWPLARLSTWLADYVTHRPPRIPLEGVRMAKYVMHYDCAKAIRELDVPQTPVETALEKAVRWFRAHGYA